MRNVCLKQRMAESVKTLNLGALQEQEREAVYNKLTPDVFVLRPFNQRLNLIQSSGGDEFNDRRRKYFQTTTSTDAGDILIQVVDYEADQQDQKADGSSGYGVTKYDREMFVLNWLQTVEGGGGDGGAAIESE